MEIEKETSRRASVRPGLVTGALVAAMLTASLISVLYLAWKVAGLPFVPFDVFDWMTRFLPGQVLAAGIGAMVTVIRALNLGPTAAAAKAAEQTMGIASMFFMGLLAGTILFSIVRALPGRYACTPGLALGIAMGVPVELISYRVQRFEPMHQFITLSCISNPVGGDLIGTTRWTGVSLQRLLASLPLRVGATHLKIRATDGFYEIVSLETIRSDECVMLTYGWDGLPLLPQHGFP
jgi:hypothetical protein